MNILFLFNINFYKTPIIWNLHNYSLNGAVKLFDSSNREKDFVVPSPKQVWFFKEYNIEVPQGAGDSFRSFFKTSSFCFSLVHAASMYVQIDYSYSLIVIYSQYENYHS